MSSTTTTGALARIAFSMLVLAAGASILARAANAQESAESASSLPAAFGERLEVTLVTVDVWVTDRDGRPVSGLDAASFEVLHDGQPVPTTHFAEVQGGTVVGATTAPDAEADAAAEPQTAQPSHLVLYFDGSRLHPTNLGAVIEGLEALLDAGVVDPERVLVVRQGWNLTVEAPFGSTEEQLRQALERLTKGDPRGAVYENETRLALEAVRTAWEESEDIAASGAAGAALAPGASDLGAGGGGGGGGGGLVGGNDPRSAVGGVGTGGASNACGLFVNQIRPTLDAWARSRSQRMAVTLTALSDLAGFLAGLPGVKTLVYLSDGLETKPGTALATYASSLCPGAGAELLRSGNLENESNSFLTLTRHANANRVTMHTVQATGLRSPRTGSAASSSGPRGRSGQRSLGLFESTERTSSQDGMILIADQTGGQTVFDRNEFGPAFVSIGEASRNYYSLTYEPPKTGDDRKSHRIDVKLADETLTARYRRGYLEKDSDRWLTERVEGALNLGITGNALGVRLGAGDVQPGDDGKQRLPLHVLIPVERLAFLPQDSGYAAEITLRVLARDVDQGTLAITDQTYRVKGTPGATGVARLPIVLELAEGRHLTAVGVQDRGSGEASFVTTMLDSRSAG